MKDFFYYLFDYKELIRERNESEKKYLQYKKRIEQLERKIDKKNNTIITLLNLLKYEKEKNNKKCVKCIDKKNKSMIKSN